MYNRSNHITFYIFSTKRKMPVKKYTIVDGETAQNPTLQQEIQAVSDYED